MSINVKDCMTRAQEAALRKEIKQTVYGLLRDEANSQAKKLGEAWIKANSTMLKEAVAEHMEKEMAKAIKRLRLYPNVESY
jgi:hypothetical protein